MPRYLIERYVQGVGNISKEQWKEIHRRAGHVAKEMAPHSRWIESFVTQDYLYCVFEAEDEGWARAHAQSEGFPCGRVLEITDEFRSRDMSGKADDAADA